MDIKHLWCRQINIEKPVYTSFKWIDDLPQVPHNVSSVIVKKQKQDEDMIGQVLWKSDDTLSHSNDKITNNTYVNADLSNTILFASGNKKSVFGVRDGDAIWTGTDSRWYINHHVFDSDVKNSMIQFNLLMGNADSISIQLGNRSTPNWIYDNTYVFGGYEFILMGDGGIFSRVEYFYGKAPNNMSIVRAFGLAEKKIELPFTDITSKEIGIRAAFQNVKGSQEVVGNLWIDHDLNGNWVQYVTNRKWVKDNWHVNIDDIPKGRIDTKEILEGVYTGPKHHWGIARYITDGKTDNGSLINKITVFKLSEARL